MNMLFWCLTSRSVGFLYQSASHAWGNRRILLQRSPSTLGLALRSVLLERLHGDAVVEGGLVGCVEIDSGATRDSQSLVNRCWRDVAGVATRGSVWARFEKAHLGTTGSSGPLAASIASFHLAVHKHHLHPGSSPISLKLLPREALKSRNSFVTWPVLSSVFGGFLLTWTGQYEDRLLTSYGMIAPIFRSDTAISIAVEACHGRLGEEGEGLLEDYNTILLGSGSLCAHMQMDDPLQRI